MTIKGPFPPSKAAFVLAAFIISTILGEKYIKDLELNTLFIYNII